MKFLPHLILLATISSAHAQTENCRVILESGYDEEVAQLLVPKDLKLVDENTFDATEIKFRIHNDVLNLNEEEFTQKVRFTRNDETLMYRDHGSPGDSRANFLKFVADLPTCEEIHQNF